MDPILSVSELWILEMYRDLKEFVIGVKGEFWRERKLLSEKAND
jgi:hypothetical protein